ncbi:MAG: NAD(P)-dependent oxidoreductase, partial [Alphaproteobacteria bacterium]
MRYFPAFMAVEGQRVVIVGDGELAAQKLRLLARTAAEIALVARRPAPALRDLVARTGARLIEAAFEPA